MIKTLLIVEDEKLIRQGIRTMIVRSGVPVSGIIECPNGEAALDILKNQSVDVMFTDIRMPKMDGIELVQKMQELPHIPRTIAVSGYDDFSYAVEMLRGGVKDYLLKPIDRARLTKLLHELDEEIEAEQHEREKQTRYSRQQLQLILSEEGTIDAREIGELLTAAGGISAKQALDDGYRFVCKNAAVPGEIPDRFIGIGEIEGNEFFLLSSEVDLSAMDSRFCIGASALHFGSEELTLAYREALSARAEAFFRNAPAVIYSSDTPEIPESLRADALRQLGSEAQMTRVQLIGTEKTEELRKAFSGLFFVAEKRRITTEEFCAAMNGFLDELNRMYRNILADYSEKERADLRSLREVLAAEHLRAYEEKLISALTLLRVRIAEAAERGGNQKKMKQAVAYIRENYAMDLNMAVVSNLLSMNYSQFSLAFKKYTGENFVNYLRNIRMEEARRLLAESDRRIGEIAALVGYDNDKHFMKVFKSCFGVSPSEYRRNIEIGRGETEVLSLKEASL